MSIGEETYEGMEEEDFYKQVGLLIEDDLDVLRENGFKDGSFESNGMFQKDKLDELMEFCETHPEFHIVTVVDTDGCTIYLNDIHYVNRMGYYLANGDNDPTLFFEHRYDEDEYEGDECDRDTL